MGAAVDPLRPPKLRGMGRGAALALLAHLGLLVALAIAVRWRSSEPEGVSAELWAAVPQQAAPREEPAPPPPPPQPKPRAEPRPEPREADIAVEKARREKERLERERLEREKEKEKEKARLAQQKRDEQEAQRKKQEEDKRLAKLREDQIKRMQGLADATGGPTSTGTAARDAGPSAGYAGRIKARIKPHIVLLDEVPGNPTAEVEVRAAPDGTIVARKILKGSGNKDWDDAVLRAIDRAEVLPRDVDGRVPSPIVITFRPRE